MTRMRGDIPVTLTGDQDMELLCGPYIGPDWPNDGGTKEFRRERSNFASEEERRQAWLAHRERITEWCLQGRPWAAEHYDAE